MIKNFFMRKADKPDFAGAFNSIPKNVKYTHHGRTIKDGLDCVGLPMLVYELVGLPFKDLDTPYGERDCFREQKMVDLVARLTKSFGVTSVIMPSECQDGDLLLLGDPGRPTHLALFIDGKICQMVGKAVRKFGKFMIENGRLESTDPKEAWKFVTEIRRHKKLDKTFSDEAVAAFV